MSQLEIFKSITEDLPVIPAPAVQPKIKWSFSKMQCFRDCPRKYYFNYYGTKKRTAKTESQKNRLIELSKLSNKYIVQGNLIHHLISTYFKKARLGEVWDFKRISSFAHKIIEETIEYNEMILLGDTPEDTIYPKPLLKEILYNHLPLEDLKAEMIDEVDNCMKHFFESDEYKSLREGGLKEFAKIEGDTFFTVNDYLSVDGKVDIAFLDQKRLKIADWKTGKKALEDTSLQLLVYALWARQFKEWKFDQVEIEKAYLLDGSLEKLEFSEINVERARVRILQDAELLTEMDEYGKNAIKDAFTKHIGQNCKSCPYEEICHEKI